VTYVLQGVRIGDQWAAARVEDDQSGAVLPSDRVGREKQPRTGQPAPFGVDELFFVLDPMHIPQAVMGLAPGGIPAYSCDYDLAATHLHTHTHT